MLLAIDTSAATAGLACFDERGLLAECGWLAGREHTAQLMPQLALLFKHLGRGPDSLSAVAVALGPGSWSGLRVGLSTAKGLAIARGLPIVGVGALDALMHQYARHDYAGAGVAIVPLIRLGRERFATVDPGSPGALAPRSVTLPALCAEIRGAALFCGDVDQDVQAALRAELGERARFPAPPAAQRRAGYLADLAWRRLRAGAVDDVATLEPIYLGQPVKQT